MWKQRIIAIVLLAISIGLGYLVYHTEMTKSKSFQLGLDLSGGTHLVYNADVSRLTGTQIPEALSVLRDVIERRVNSLGVSEASVTNETSSISGTKQYRLVVDLPGVNDVNKALEIIGQTPLLEFATENPKFDPNAKLEINITPDMIKNGQLDLSAAAKNLQLPYLPTELTGQYLAHSTLEYNNTTGAPIVGLQFNPEGAKMFEEITKANVGKTIAIYLDGQIISAPTVNEAITGGQAVINGTFTPEEARQLVGRLNSGALPVPVTLLSTETIGPTLGADALKAGIHAGLVGLIAIMILLIVWYRLPGVVASVTLIMYSIAMFALFKYIPVTLSSAGIAGFIISLGMAVDANILIYERMKEEVKSGKPLLESINAGFARAWTSIRDGNISSIISAFILFIFGTTLIKGFAITFGLGVFVSMLSAIVISRVLLKVVAGKKHGRIKQFLFSSGFSK
jgi:protein-export membrane protein SecD